MSFMQGIRESIFLAFANIPIRARVYDRIRFIFLKLAGVQINGRALIYGNASFRPYGACANIHIGNGTFINEYVRFSSCKSTIYIGYKCHIASRVSFECASHSLVCDPQHERELISESIVVGNRVWIGAGVTVLGGAVIGDDVVVAAGSVVKGILIPGWVYGGTPARQLKQVKQIDQKE